MRQVKPYFKASHQAWYVNLHGKPHRLGTNEEEAWQEYHRLMTGEEPVTSKTTVAAILERYLQWTKENRSAGTLDFYTRHLRSFDKHVGDKLRAVDLKPHHVERWLAAKYKKSGNTHRHGACRSLTRAFNWARRQGLIDFNPLATMEKPTPETREGYLTADQWEAIKAHIGEGPLLDLLQFMRETGCRPWEARHVEARHWERTNHRLVLELALTKGKKGKKLPRIIRLNERAEEIMQRLALKHPEGPIFRNNRGKPWGAVRLANRCVDLTNELGFHVFAYIFRHTFCTDALLRGVDPVTVALLMGHKDGTMVMQVYNHLILHNDFLQEKLKQATG